MISIPTIITPSWPVDVQLLRLQTGDEGTLGLWTFYDQAFFTMEPPWRDNKQNVSCFSAGVWWAYWTYGEKFGWRYTFQDIPDRFALRVHPGNVGGNRDKGLKTNTEGCVLPGKSRGELWGQMAVLNSTAACMAIETAASRRPLRVTVRNLWEDT